METVGGTCSGVISVCGGQFFGSGAAACAAALTRGTGGAAGALEFFASGDEGLQSVGSVDVPGTGRCVHVSTLPRAGRGDCVGVVTDTGGVAVYAVEVAAEGASRVALSLQAAGSFLLGDDAGAAVPMQTLPPVVLAGVDGSAVWVIAQPPRELGCVTVRWGAGGASCTLSTCLRSFEQPDPFAAGLDPTAAGAPVNPPPSLQPHILAVSAHPLPSCADPCVAVLVRQPLVPNDPVPVLHVHVCTLVGLGGTEAPAPAAPLRNAGWLVKNVTPGTQVLHPLVVDGGSEDGDGAVLVAGPERLELYSVKGLQCMAELSTTPKVESLAALGVPTAVVKLGQGEHGARGANELGKPYRGIGSAGSSRRGNSGGGAALRSVTCEYALVTDQHMVVLFTVKRSLTIEAKPRRYYTIEISGAVSAAEAVRGGADRAAPSGVAFIAAPADAWKSQSNNGAPPPPATSGRVTSPVSPHAASCGAILIAAEHRRTVAVEVDRGRLRPPGSGGGVVAAATHHVASLAAGASGRVLYSTAQGALYRAGKSVLFQEAMADPAPLVGYAALLPVTCGAEQFVVLAFAQGVTVLHMASLSFLPPPEELEEAVVLAAGGCRFASGAHGVVLAATDGIHVLEDRGEAGFAVVHHHPTPVEHAHATAAGAVALASRDAVALYDYTTFNPSAAASTWKVWQVSAAAGDVAAVAATPEAVFYGCWGGEVLTAVPDERRTPPGQEAGVRQVTLPGTPRRLVTALERGLLFAWCIGDVLALVRADADAPLAVVATCALANTPRMNLTVLRDGWGVWSGAGVVEVAGGGAEGYTLERHPTTTRAEDVCTAGGEVVWLTPAADPERDLWIGDVAVCDWHVEELAAGGDAARRLVVRLADEIGDGLFATAEVDQYGALSVAVWAETARGAAQAQRLGVEELHPAELLCFAAGGKGAPALHVTAAAHGAVWYLALDVEVLPMAAATPAVRISPVAAMRLGGPGGGLALLSSTADVPALCGVRVLQGDRCGMQLPAECGDDGCWGLAAIDVRGGGAVFSEVSGPVVGIARSGSGRVLCAIALSGIDVLAPGRDGKEAAYTRLFHCDPSLVTYAVQPVPGGPMYAAVLGGDGGDAAVLMALEVDDGAPPAPDALLRPRHAAATAVPLRKAPCRVAAATVGGLGCTPAAVACLPGGRVLCGGRHGLGLWTL